MYCECCKKQAHFIVKFKYDDTCDECENHITITDDVLLCKLNCKELSFILINHTIKNDRIDALYLCDKSDCFYCGTRIAYELTTTGSRSTPK